MNAFAFIRAEIVRSEIVGTGKLGSVSGGYRSRDGLFRDRRPIGGSDRRDVGCDIKFLVVSNGHVEGSFRMPRSSVSEQCNRLFPYQTVGYLKGY